MSLWDSVIVATVLATLAYASYRDYKSREVPELTWLPGLVVVVIVNLIQSSYNFLELAISSLPVVMVLILSAFDLMGGADFLALAFVLLAHPRIYPKPITFMTLIYSLIPPLTLIIYNLFHNLRFLKHYKGLTCVVGSKVGVYVFGEAVKVSQFLKSKFTYLLTIPEDVERYAFRCRASFTLDDNYEESLKNMVRELVNAKRIDEDHIVWVTPGLPHVVFYLVGYAASLLTPIDLIAKLLMP